MAVKSENAKEWLTVDHESVNSYIGKLSRFVKEENFPNFRSNPDWKIWEDGSFGVGNISLKRMKRKRYGNLLRANLEELRKNDVVGTPRLHKFDDLGAISSSTLQYAADAFSLKSVIDEINRNSNQSAHIVEIGAGFGGLCRIISSIYPVRKYSIIDIAPALKLSEKYLSSFPDLNCDFHFVKAEEKESIEKIKDIDLVIAVASLAELNEETQIFYNATILMKASYIFVAYNTLFRNDSRLIFLKLYQDWNRTYEIRTWVGLQGRYFILIKQERTLKKTFHNLFFMTNLSGILIRIQSRRLYEYVLYQTFVGKFITTRRIGS